MELNLEDQRKITYLNLSCLLSFTIFTILAVLQLEDVLNVYWLIVCIPLLWSILSVPLALHSYIHFSPKKIKTNLGNVVILFTTYSSSVGILTATVLISCKADGMIDAPWGLVLIPVRFTCFTFLLFQCFMCPGFMDPKIAMQRQGFLLLLYIITFTVTSILVTIKLEGGLSAHWAVVFVAVWICAAVHGASILYIVIKHTIFEIREVATLLLVTVAFLLLSVHDGSMIRWPVVAIPVWLLLGFYSLEVLSAARQEFRTP